MESLMSWGGGRDEELGKRDDDYMAARRKYPATSWASSSSRKGAHQQATSKTRRRQIIILLVVCVLLYLWHISGSNSNSPRPGSTSKIYDIVSPKAPSGPPPTSNSKAIKGRTAKTGNPELEGQGRHYFSGPIKFYHLKKSLETTRVTNGYKDNNRNVLFAASSLKSVANILPLACEMATVNHNHVHLAIFGREAIPLDDILALNGISKKTCRAYFHDGRPDYSEYSTDARAEASVVGAMNHVHGYVHPQVVITDDESVEDAFFMRGIRGKLQEINRPVIELPAKRYEDFRWMSQLTSAALSSWHRPKIEILIHSPPNASGGLARLLKSLSAADYGGFRMPKLTVELPANEDSTLKSFMNDFSWPPRRHSQKSMVNLLQVHKRIPSTKLTTEESSIRFVESYYPSHYVDDHVLILSPNAVLSPSFFHYIMSTLLQARYSSFVPPERDLLAGLTLTTPTNLLDGSSEFKPPAMTALKTEIKDVADEESATPYLWQSPSSDAMLVICERWVEFHDYLRLRLKFLHEHPDAEQPKKAVSSTHPAWLEYFVELARARGWTFLYPPSTQAGTWVTIHQELAKTPEEFRATITAKPASDSEPADSAEDFLSAPSPSEPIEPEQPLNPAQQPLHELLPFNAVLPSLEALPLLSLSGESVADVDTAIATAQKHTKTLRSTLGGCAADRAEHSGKRIWSRAGDLFCQPGEEAAEELTPDELELLWPGAREDKEESASAGALRERTRAQQLKASAKAGQEGKKTAAETKAEAEVEKQVKPVAKEVEKEERPTTKETEKAEKKSAAKETEEVKPTVKDEVAKSAPAVVKEAAAAAKGAAANLDPEDIDDTDEELDKLLAPKKLPHVAKEVNA